MSEAWTPPRPASPAPVYVTSIDGTGGTQWSLVGANAIYDNTATRFRVYMRWHDATAISPVTAQQYGWCTNRIGYDSP
ncbi:hypothetical protein [Nonomuraea endophytica]|uniref:hypothetical protein n=1 Tax=Nonomuraea endophytica TaxID=714136 RepID=UPI0037CA7BE9